MKLDHPFSLKRCITQEKKVVVLQTLAAPVINQVRRVVFTPVNASCHYFWQLIMLIKS